jgi:hypothetical protein
MSGSCQTLYPPSTLITVRFDETLLHVLGFRLLLQYLRRGAELLGAALEIVVRQLGVGPPRAQHVDGDRRRDLVHHGAHHADQAVLAGAVPHGSAARLRVARADVNDAAVVLLHHLRERRAGRVVRRRQVEEQMLFEQLVVGGERQDLLELVPVDPTRIVDEDVESAEALDDLRDGPLDSATIERVTYDRQTLGAERADLLHDGIQLVLRA